MNKRRVLTGPPAAGKSYQYLCEVIETPNKYLIALPRREFIEEMTATLRSMVPDTKQCILIDAIYSPDDGRSHVPIATQIEDAPHRYADHDHVVLFATHEGIMGCDLRGFHDWHFVMDETPNAILSDSVRVPAVARLLREFIDLLPCEHSGWSLATLRPDAPSQKIILNDDLLKGKADFFKRLRSQQAVYVNVRDWSELIDNVSKRLQWHSVWSLAELKSFKSITLAGSGFFDSIFYKVMQRIEGDDAQYERVQIGRPRLKLPTATIRYFTAGHRGTTAFWKSDVGKDCLTKIARYFSALPMADFYWSANDGVRDVIRSSMGGKEVRPKQEGTNSLSSYPNAAFIYSAKAQTGDQAILKLYGLTKADIARSREYEDMIQFAMRGIIRDHDFAGEYTVYVNDKHQADMLADYLVQNGIAVAKAEPVTEVSIMDIQRPKTGPKPRQIDTIEAAKKANERRAKDKTRKRKKRERDKEYLRAAGIEIQRGRPKKEEVSARVRQQLTDFLMVLKSQPPAVSQP